MDLEEYRHIYEVESSHWWYCGKRRLLASLLRHHSSGGSEPRRILNIGCGTGLESKMLEAFGDVVAVDLEYQALLFSKAQGVGSLVQANGLQLPFADESFDIIVASEVFEHVEEDHQLLRQLHRLLRRDGSLVFTVPAHPFLYSEHDRRVHHVRRYTRARLHDVVRQGGFEEKVFGSYNVILGFPVAVYRLFSKLWPPSKSDHSVFLQGGANTLGNVCMRIEDGGRFLFGKLFGTTYYGLARKIPD